jgi:hypothetical protein
MDTIYQTKLFNLVLASQDDFACRAKPKYQRYSVPRFDFKLLTNLEIAGAYIRVKRALNTYNSYISRLDHGKYVGLGTMNRAHRDAVFALVKFYELIRGISSTSAGNPPKTPF